MKQSHLTNALVALVALCAGVTAGILGVRLAPEGAPEAIHKGSLKSGVETLFDFGHANVQGPAMIVFKDGPQVGNCWNWYDKDWFASFCEPATKRVYPPIKRPANEQ